MRVRTLAMFAIGLALGSTAGDAQTAGLNAPQLFDQGMNALRGSSVTRSDANALEYFHRSADLGFAPAQVVLGYLFETGRGTTVNAREALGWYKKAAEQDDPLAQWLAGRLIYAGSVPGRDLNEASAFFQSAADHGDAFGEYLLGRVKLDRQDYPKAATWFGKAAQQGCRRRKSNSRSCCGTGKGSRRTSLRPMSGCW
jgi:TPR repeat protein